MRQSKNTELREPPGSTPQLLVFINFSISQDTKAVNQGSKGFHLLLKRSLTSSCPYWFIASHRV